VKIAQITPYFHPHLGGVESHVRDLARKLTERGHEVHVITSRFEPDIPETEEMMGFFIHRLKPVAIIARTPIVPSIRTFLKLEDFDIIHAHSPPPLSSYYSASAAHKKGIPFVYTYHCDMEIPVPAGKYIVSLYRLLFERKTTRWASAIICTTNSYAATSRATWDREVDIIPNAVDATHFRPDVSGERVREKYGLKGKTVVLFVGRLVHHKGIETLLRSADYTEEPVHYLIVGKGYEFARLKRMAEEVDRERFIFTGPVSAEELPEFYAASDIFVLPSISRLEAFGIVGLEAMSSGKPVILSNIPGVREVITPGVEGVEFETASAEDMGKRIMELHSDSELRAEMGKRGRERVLRDYSWERVMKDIEALYLRVAKKKEMNRK